MKEAEGIACLVLAAGFSRRFGASKMRHPLIDGRPILLATLELYQHKFEKVTVVVRESDSDIVALLAGQNVNLVDSPDSDKGMSQSLIAGVKACKNAHAWLIALGDMPYIKPATVNSILSNITEDSIVVPRCRKQPGNPVAFGCKYYADLLSVNGDNGAKSIIQKYPDKVFYLDLDDDGVLRDIDKPEDIEV